MVKLLLLHKISRLFVASTTAWLTLSTVVVNHAVAADLFNFDFDGTLTGADPLGTSVTSQRLSGRFLLDVDTIDNSSTPIAGRYNGAIRNLDLTFASTSTRNAVTLNAADFPGNTNRVFVGTRGSEEELQFLLGNIATQAPFFQPPSVGVIFSSRDLPLTTQLKEVLKPKSGTFKGEFKLVSSVDRVETPNNSFFGSISIAAVPEPDNTPGFLLLLGFAFFSAARLRNKKSKPKI